MKNYKQLRIAVLISLASGSSSIDSRFVENIENQDEIALLTQQAIRDEAATLEVLQDLAVSHPAIVEQIVEETKDLESEFNNIRAFMRNKNKEIERLLQQNSVAEAEVARLAVELAQAKADFEKALAEHRAQHKHPHKNEQSIKQALAKGLNGVKTLHNRAVNYMKKNMLGGKRIVSPHRGGMSRKQAAQAAVTIPGVQDEVAQNLAAQYGITNEEAHAIINDALADNEDNMMTTQVMPMSEEVVEDEVVVQSMPPTESQKQRAQKAKQKKQRGRQSTTQH